MTQNNKTQYKLQKDDSKKMVNFKNLKLKKDKFLHIAIGTIYVTSLLASIFLFEYIDSNYKPVVNNKSKIEQDVDNNYNLSNEQKEIKINQNKVKVKSF